MKSIRVLLGEHASADDLVDRAVEGEGRHGQPRRRSRPAVTLNPQLKFKLPGATQAQAFPGPLVLHAGESPLVSQQRVPRHVHDHVDGKSSRS